MGEKNDIIVYPTISKVAFEISINNTNATGKATILIVDAGGKLISDHTVQFSQGINNIPFNLSDKSSGLYYIQVLGTSGVVLGRGSVIRN